MSEQVDLVAKAKQIRRDAVRLMREHGGTHFGGTLSCIDILVAIYYRVMQPQDRFILSKGHAAFALYAILRDKGMNPKMDGFPEYDPANGIWATTGSLGHGLPIACGMAMAKKLRGEPGRIFVLCGDGELQEGTTWESLLQISRRNLDNIVAIVDDNQLQGCALTFSVLKTHIADIANVFGIQTCGRWGINPRWHSLDWVLDGLTAAVPHLIAVETIKGHGISFMENKAEWHSRTPTDQEWEQIERELA